jgi:L-ascorbate metabolism protein UlaG (beta-lactamase superfamily)
MIPKDSKLGGYSLMLRICIVVTACVSTVSLAFSHFEQQPPGKTTVSWHGQSFFSVKSSQGTVFVFDPHAIPVYGRIEGILPDVIMISHSHNDHTQVGIFDNYTDPAEKLPEKKEPADKKDAGEKKEVVAKGPKIIMGLKPGEGGRETWNIIDEQFKDLHITSFGAYHDDVKGMKHGLTALFVVEVDGWRICHLGDLGHALPAKQLKALGSLDVVMVPCGGIYGLNGTDARHVIDQLKPKQFILPMHIGTNRYDELLPVDEFIDEGPYPCAIVRDGALLFSNSARNNVAWLKENTRNSHNALVLERHKQTKPIVVNLNYWPQVSDKKKK